MSRCGNGTSRSFFCARSFQAVRTRATEFRWRGWPVYRKKFWIEPKTSLRIWKTRTARSPTANQDAKDRRKSFLNRKSRNSICCELACAGGEPSLNPEGPSAKSQEFTFQYCTCNSEMLAQPELRLSFPYGTKD